LLGIIAEHYCVMIVKWVGKHSFRPIIFCRITMRIGYIVDQNSPPLYFDVCQRRSCINIRHVRNDVTRIVSCNYRNKKRSKNGSVVQLSADLPVSSDNAMFREHMYFPCYFLCTLLLVSLDDPFLIAPPVFSNVFVILWRNIC